MSELYYRLALQFLPNLGPTTIKKMLQHYGSATQIFTARDTETEKIAGSTAYPTFSTVFTRAAATRFYVAASMPCRQFNVGWVSTHRSLYRVKRWVDTHPTVFFRRRPFSADCASMPGLCGYSDGLAFKHIPSTLDL